MVGLVEAVGLGSGAGGGGEAGDAHSLAEVPERMEQLFLSWGTRRGASFRGQRLCSA